jgi:hypothetical protein
MLLVVYKRDYYGPEVIQMETFTKECLESKASVYTASWFRDKQSKLVRIVHTIYNNNLYYILQGT